MRYDWLGHHHSRLDSPVHRWPASAKLASALGVILVTVIAPFSWWGWHVGVAVGLVEGLTTDSCYLARIDIGVGRRIIPDGAAHGRLVAVQHDQNERRSPTVVAGLPCRTNRRQPWCGPVTRDQHFGGGRPVPDLQPVRLKREVGRYLYGPKCETSKRTQVHAAIPLDTWFLIRRGV